MYAIWDVQKNRVVESYKTGELRPIIFTYKKDAKVYVKYQPEYEIRKVRLEEDNEKA